jgi:hypothetical protein
MSMANISDMLNIPTPIVLGDKVRKFRRLEVAEVFGMLEREILDEYADRMQKVSDSLSGKDKVDYLVQMSQAMPAGHELANLAINRVSTLSGLLKLFKLSLLPEADANGQPLPDPDIVTLLNENPKLVGQLTKAIVGIEAKVVKPEAGGEAPLPQGTKVAG